MIVFCFFLLSSCNKAESYFNTGRYEKVLDTVEHKKILSKTDYLYYAKSLVKLGRKEEARESILLYLLMATETDERDFATDLFVDLNFSDTLNVLLLKPADGTKQQIALYKSYVALEDVNSALAVLDFLSESMSFPDFVSLIVRYTASDNYNLMIFNTWYENIYDSEFEDFSLLLSEFSENENLSEQVLKDLIELTEKVIKNEIPQKDEQIMSSLYYVLGNVLTGLHDNHNASVYYKEALRLNPENEKLIQLVGELSDD